MDDEERTEIETEVDAAGYPAMPTVDDCLAFMEAINAGRRAIGLDGLDALEFDDCEPSDEGNCLSAHHLFVRGRINRIEGLVASVASVGALEARVPAAEARALAEAFGTSAEAVLGDYANVRIPYAILKVTNVFDDSERTAALREVMVEAGLVD